MTAKKYDTPRTHTSAWIAQTWISFAIALSATATGIFYLPVNGWLKGYLGMGMLFSIGSTISLSKTVRDIEESKRITNRIDEAKLERLLADYDPYNSLNK
ncbi:YiaA/YiaB family inner membrane protein [Oscillatoria sp. CS-180]|uniref:YiaA/YiaB family inner membrane protein n=1 Tax=Oscillatoria sp. CS-180 TaxID=3021720 RepID=UPI00232D8C92|nr:YiaA/YiaB family inner membrane protein [Oscillatoria sp. CS-180]MDB9528152.1 YiaA/YiaB family inner membrane protein [Oscillatoria sp. CS-180]